jgi:hypothetical protein
MSMMSCFVEKEMFSVLLRVDVGRWRSIVQAEEMEPLFEFVSETGSVSVFR